MIFMEGIVRRYPRENDQMKKDKRTNNDLQNTTQKTKDQVTRTSLSTRANLCAPEEWEFPVPLVVPVV